MDNHSSLSTPTNFLFENTNGSIYPNDLVLSIIEDVSTSPPNTNGNLSPSSSSSLDVSANQISFPCCIFRCKPNSHPFQERCIPLHEQVKVGRAVARLKALPNNAIFDCKVLSRQHAKLWYENGKVRSRLSDVFHVIVENEFILVFTTRHQKFKWYICEQ